MSASTRGKAVKKGTLFERWLVWRRRYSDMQDPPPNSYSSYKAGYIAGLRAAKRASPRPSAGPLVLGDAQVLGYAQEK